MISYFINDLKEKSVTDKNARIKFVMVHHFVKKANKTPKKELERTRNNMKDYIERNGA